MLYDITAKDLCKYYPVYTKAGFIWKNRIDWEVIQVPGNKVKTYFGIFTFLRAYKVDKVWYWVLTDGTKTITVKRDQARKNKKLPKTATIQTTLMLGQPQDPLDYYVAQCIRIRDEYNNSLKNNPNNYTTKGTLKRNIQRQLINYQPPTLEVGTIILGGLVYDKQMQCDEYVQFISSVCYAIHNIQLLKSIKRNLIRSYHPDTNSYFADPIKLDCVKNIFIDTEEEIIC